MYLIREFNFVVFLKKKVLFWLIMIILFVAHDDVNELEREVKNSLAQIDRCRLSPRLGRLFVVSRLRLSQFLQCCGEVKGAVELVVFDLLLCGQLQLGQIVLGLKRQYN